MHRWYCTGALLKIKTKWLKGIIPMLFPKCLNSKLYQLFSMIVSVEIPIIPPALAHASGVKS